MAKILIIDDDVDFIDLMQIRLEAHGFEVITASDGMQAIKLAHTEQPHLIILDLFFPAGGGLATLHNFKMSSNTHTIPVIIISGTGDKELIEKVKKEDIAGFVQKPYAADDLIALIREIIPGEDPDDDLSIFE